MNKELIIQKLQEIISLLNDAPEKLTTKQKNLLEWPRATSTPDTLDADSIVKKSMMAIEKLDILDFGSGNGYISEYLSKTAKKVISYDINTEKILAPGNYITAKTIEDVKSQGPYDLIFINDVFDHLEPADEEEKELYIETLHVKYLKTLKSFLKSSGRIYLRCHPWTSRHGGHLQKTQNMAFIHLILTEEEYLEQSVSSDVQITHQIYSPEQYYLRCIQKSGLNVLKTNQEKDYPEQFVKDRLLDQIAQKFPPNTLPEKILDIIQASYISFVLY